MDTEFKRHRNHFDCYNDLDDKEPANEEYSAKIVYGSAARVIPEPALNAEKTLDAEKGPDTELFTTDKSTTVEEILEEQPIESQFGPISSQSHRYVSQHMGGPLRKHIVDEPAYFYLLTTYLSYLILRIIGHVRDFFRKRFKPEKYKDYKERDGYAALNSD